MAAKRLGRGINALIRETPNETVPSDTILHLSLKLISPNPHQPRQEFDKSSLKELAESIKEKGIIQPITVRSKGKSYELVAGERRLRAAKLAGLKKIPAHLIEIKSDSEMMEMALIENIQRENLNVVEEAEAYTQLNEKYKLSHTLIAKAVGKSRASISNTLRLLKLPSTILESLRKNEISAGHARALLGVKDKTKLLVLWKRIVERNESVRTVEELVAQISDGKAPLKKRKKKLKLKKSADLRKLEDDLIGIFGTKVSISEKGKGGTIEISYFSDDDLERILDLIAEVEG
ncbi:MAG: hypothetical protein CMG71_01785 [Candidatus Marinimicrobia bacterium]|nr:hypothetical protein [Candidatus Neomarinimicrobiota bacterium]